MKRSPMKRGRKAIKAKSARKVASDEELEAMRELVLVRSRGVCECCGTGRVEVIHHVKRRSQGGTNELSNLLGLSDLHHKEIHMNPAWAYEMGFLRRNG